MVNVKVFYKDLLKLSIVILITVVYSNMPEKYIMNGLLFFKTARD